MTKFPRKPEQFRNRLDRISEHCKSDSQMMRIAPIARLECELVLHAYYGSGARAGLAMLRTAFFLWRNDIYSAVKITIADRVGWTKLYDLPGTGGLKMRHGRKCSGSPNCNNMHCIEDSIPKWYRWLTRWDK